MRNIGVEILGIVNTASWISTLHLRSGPKFSSRPRKLCEEGGRSRHGTKWLYDRAAL